MWERHMSYSFCRHHVLKLFSFRMFHKYYSQSIQARTNNTNYEEKCPLSPIPSLKCNNNNYKKKKKFVTPKDPYPYFVKHTPRGDGYSFLASDHLTSYSSPHC